MDCRSPITRTSRQSVRSRWRLPNHNLIYIGTGEAAPRGDMTYGNGVYKSVDAGKTWQSLGLADTRQIGAVVVDPKNPDIVLVAALGHAFGPNSERGVYRTTDGGKSWTRVLSKDDNTGAIDVTFDPQQFEDRLCIAVAGAAAAVEFFERRTRAAGFIVRPMAARPGRSSTGQRVAGRDSRTHRHLGIRRQFKARLRDDRGQGRRPLSAPKTAARIGS